MVGRGADMGAATGVFVRWAQWHGGCAAPHLTCVTHAVLAEWRSSEGPVLRMEAPSPRCGMSDAPPARSRLRVFWLTAAENIASTFYPPWKNFSSVYSNSQTGGFVPSLCLRIPQAQPQWTFVCIVHDISCDQGRNNSA